jgi:excisionase family DNA binding protein
VTKAEKHAQLIDGAAGFGRRIAHSIKQAAITSGRSRSRIYKAIKDKELEAHKDGRATIVTDDELRRWVNAMPTIGRTRTSEVRHDA